MKARSAIFAETERQLGHCWPLLRAIVASMADIRLAEARKSGSDDDSAGLFLRAQSARAWRGTPRRWVDLLDRSEGNERMFWMAMFWAWAPSQHVAANLESVDRIVAEMGAADFVRVARSVHFAREARRFGGGSPRKGIELDSTANSRTRTLAYRAFGRAQLRRMDVDGSEDPALKRAVRANETVDVLKSFPGWSRVKSGSDAQRWLEVCAEAHSAGLSTELLDFDETRHLWQGTMAQSVATVVLSGGVRYPPVLVELARDSILRRYAPESVRAVAVRMGWSVD